MTVRQHILAALDANAHPSELRLRYATSESGVQPGRYLAVLILDNDTSTYREVTAHTTHADALAELEAPDDPLLIGEYIIDLDAVSLSDCCWQVLETGALGDKPVPFTDDYITFA